MYTLNCWSVWVCRPSGPPFDRQKIPVLPPQRPATYSQINQASGAALQTGNARFSVQPTGQVVVGTRPRWLFRSSVDENRGRPPPSRPLADQDLFSQKRGNVSTAPKALWSSARMLSRRAKASSLTPLDATRPQRRIFIKTRGGSFLIASKSRSSANALPRAGRTSVKAPSEHVA